MRQQNFITDHVPYHFNSLYEIGLKTLFTTDAHGQFVSHHIRKTVLRLTTYDYQSHYFKTM